MPFVYSSKQISFMRIKQEESIKKQIIWKHKKGSSGVNLEFCILTWVIDKLWVDVTNTSNYNSHCVSFKDPLQFNFSHFMWCMIYLHVCFCVKCVPGSLKCRKRVLDLLELELRTAVRYQVGDGDCILALFKSS